jgi:hypothetical protein
MERSLALSYEVLDAQLAPVAVGYAGQGTIDVSDGRYTVVVHAPGKRITVGDRRMDLPSAARANPSARSGGCPLASSSSRSGALISANCGVTSRPPP